MSVSNIDWQHVGEVIRSREDRPDWKLLSGSTELACAALEYIIGAERLSASVDHYVSGGAESELARSVLWRLHPWAAMRRCYEIYSTAAEIEDRRSAVELLRVVADRRVLPWIPQFLSDQDPGIQAWGIGVLDQLLWSRLVEPEECQKTLEIAEQHTNPDVRDKAAFIREFLEARKAPDERS